MCGGGVGAALICPSFVNAVHCVLSSFAIISMGKRELVTFL